MPSSPIAHRPAFYVSIWLPCILLTFTGGAAAVPPPAAPAPQPPSALAGFLDFNTYWDTRDFAVTTVNTLANLHDGLQYFSLANFQAAVTRPGGVDTEQYYIEHNLRWSPWSELPMDLTAQAVMRSGPRNDLLRLGFRWRLSSTPVLGQLFKAIRGFYSINPSLVGLGHTKGAVGKFQFEHVYRIDLIPKRIYLSGFLDHNLWLEPGSPGSWSRVVTEHQFGLRVVGQAYLVAEYRFNQYLGQGDRHGLGVGIEYIIPFKITGLAAAGG